MAAAAPTLAQFGLTNVSKVLSNERIAELRGLLNCGLAYPNQKTTGKDSA
jgi:hypothetical protein